MILKMSLNMGKAGKRYMPIAISMTKTSEVFPDGWHVEEIERMEEAYKTILKEDKTKV